MLELSEDDEYKLMTLLAIIEIDELEDTITFAGDIKVGGKIVAYQNDKLKMIRAQEQKPSPALTKYKVILQQLLSMEQNGVLSDAMEESLGKESLEIYATLSDFEKDEGKQFIDKWKADHFKQIN